MEKVKYTYIAERDFKEHEVELRQEHIDITNEIYEVLKAHFKDKMLGPPILEQRSETAFICGINLAEDRVEREIGTNQYDIRIEHIHDKMKRWKD